MYLALWIDESRERAGDKVICCTPLLNRQNTAVAVLRGSQHAGSDGLIFSGDQQLLSVLVRRIEQATERHPELAEGRLLAAVKWLARDTGASLVEFDASAAVLAAVKMPKVGLYPLQITREAKPLWDETLERFGKTIHKYADTRRQWAAAIIIFQRLADQHRVKPFKRDPTQDKLGNKMAREVNRRANRGNHRALQLIQDVFDDNRELLARVGPERFYEAAKNQRLYYVTTVQRLQPKKGVEPGRVIDALMDGGWGGQRGRYVFKALDQYTSVLIEPTGQVLDAYIATSMTKDLVILLFGLPEDVRETEIIKQLNAAGKRWVKTGVLVEIPRGSGAR